MKVTVLGGAGYVGSHLVNILLDKKIEVNVLDRLVFKNNQLENFKKNPLFNLFVGDIRNIRDLSKAINGSDVVIHLAGLVGDPSCQVDPEVTWSHNIESSVLISDVCNYYKVDRLLFASSCSVYGAAPSHILLNEGSYKNPVSLYAQSKIDSEKIFSEKFNGIYSTLRLATVFGYSPRMRFDLVINLFTIKGIKEQTISVFGGRQYRPFIHCYDVARAFDILLFSDEKLINREVFNVCCENYMIKDLARLVSTIVDCEVAYVAKKEDNRNYKVSSEKIEWLLGFKPEINVHDGIVEMSEKIKEFGFNDWKTDNYKNCMWDY